MPLHRVLLAAFHRQPNLVLEKQCGLPVYPNSLCQLFGRNALGGGTHLEDYHIRLFQAEFHFVEQGVGRR